MNDYENRKIREIFSRIFVIAIDNKINFYSFTNFLLKSEFLNQIQKDKYSDIFEMPIEDIFFSITGYDIEEDKSYGIYNDAYWSGQCYFDLHKKLNISFSYIFLKLPLEKMIDIYTIYHEMDFSSLCDYFREIEKQKTILNLLCKSKKCSLNDVSKATSLSLNTLKKYNSDDEALFKASFQNIAKLVDFFDVDYSLFIH